MTNKSKKSFKPGTTVDHFDPTELETTELVYKNKTEHSDYTPDTMADPEGSEARLSINTGKQFPERVHRDYLVRDGLVQVSSGTIQACMAIFDTKAETDMTLTDDQLVKYKKEVEAIVEGKKPLLFVDAPTSGYNMLSEMTRTWAEFACAIYDYTSWSRQLNPELDQPESFIALETKMHELGRKARLLRDSSSELWIFFNINGKFSLDRGRVERALQGRFERLANYYNKKFTETTIAKDMKVATADFTGSIVDSV
jgi:hypothetical protein